MSSSVNPTTLAVRFRMADFADSLVPTPYGDARVHRPAGPPAGLMMLGDGAGGGVTAHDLQLGAEVALAAGLAHLYRGDLAHVPLIVGGRSFGSRVACRTAADVGAAGVLCLAFPLHPPGRPEKSRLPELTAVAVPTLVVQGDRDPFGVPDRRTLQNGVTLVVVSDKAADLTQPPDRNWHRASRGSGR